MNTSC